jgi:hypothetical protein
VWCVSVCRSFLQVYIWARRNPFVRMSFLGLFTFTAPYLPWVLLSFSALLGNDALVDCLGIAIGHLYYFLEDVYPLMTPTRKRVLATPRVITLLFTGGLGGGGGGADQHPAVNVEHEALIQRAIDERRQAEAAAANGLPPPQQQQQPPAAAQQDEPQGVILAQ